MSWQKVEVMVRSDQATEYTHGWDESDRRPNYYEGYIFPRLNTGTNMTTRYRVDAVEQLHNQKYVARIFVTKFEG